MKRRVRFCVSWVITVLLLVVMFAGVIRGYSSLKQYGHENKWWVAPASLDSLDPKERAAAANEAARQYGAKP